VYYLQVGNDCGNIIFRSFEADTDMLPLPADILTYPNYKTMSIMPEEDNLLIFRSNLKHMVEKNISNVQRISLSMNFLFT
jgi:hypothetical protein